MKTVQLLITGRVQGVNFRKNTQQKAKKLSLTGTIQNNPDGCVTAIVQGTEKNIQALTTWMKTNPGLSNIETIQEKTIKTQKTYAHFMINRENNFFTDQKQAIKNLTRKLICD